MLPEYLRLAIGKAHYELFRDGGVFCGEIPGFHGVYAQADRLEACCEERAVTLEDWPLFRISRQLPIPVMDGVNLSVKEVESDS